MFRHVLAHQRELRSQVLQVVHEECRHYLKSLQLLCLTEFLGEPQIEEGRGGLISYGPQQLIVLKGKRLIHDSLAQSHDSDKLSRCPKGHTIAHAGDLQVCLKGARELPDWIIACPGKIDRHGLVGH